MNDKSTKEKSLMPRGNELFERDVPSKSVPSPSGLDQPRVERAVRELLLALGENPDREGLLETPKRVARSYAELFAGLTQDAGEHLARTFEQEGEDLVSLRDIEFTSFCEHHLLPVFGRAHIAYLPSRGRVVGLSKLARTVEVFARRPQLQERLTAQIADALVEHLAPQGVLVAVEAEHMCMKMRGVRKQSPVMVTLAHRGVFSAAADRRSEVLTLLGLGAQGNSPRERPSLFSSSPKVLLEDAPDGSERGLALPVLPLH
jgi:GTP cyclohydrolase IA